MLLGTILSGRYRLEARIATGGMSTVYRALDETLQRQVAIKLMNREIATSGMTRAGPGQARPDAERDPGPSDQLERFRREARAVAQLSHPHIVGVIDAGEDESRPYIVFEYVEGETLKVRIRRQGRLEVAEAVAYAIEIARALGAAHARHIVHRDVKPQTVLIDEEGSAKVTSFGIARPLDGVLAIETAPSGSATGEVTSVLRTLPSGKQRRVPFRLRHPAMAELAVLLILAALGGGAVWLATRTHHGTGHPAQAPPAPHLS